MLSVFISLIIFCISVTIHVIVFRKFSDFGKKNYKTSVVFVAGFFLLVFVLGINGQNNLWTYSSLLLYILISIYYVLLLTTLFLGEKGPSIQILDILVKNKSATFREMVLHFQRDNPTGKRLKDLVKTHIIEVRKGRYYISRKGKKAKRIIDLYRSMTGWYSSG
jgi:hypothetical protein